MPKRARAEYMRSYRLRRKLAAVEGPDADWRRMHPIAALVELARSLPDMEPDDGYLVIPPRPGTLTAPDARWRLSLLTFGRLRVYALRRPERKTRSQKYSTEYAAQMKGRQAMSTIPALDAAVDLLFAYQAKPKSKKPKTKKRRATAKDTIAVGRRS